MTSIKNSPLGKKSAYIDQYDNSLLFPIERQIKRNELDIDSRVFKGVDIWTAYELSWLSPKGKPQIAVVEFIIPAESLYLIESKSFKLYLNSFNNSRFESFAAVCHVLEKDLSEKTQAPVKVLEKTEAQLIKQGIAKLKGECIDTLDISVDMFKLDKQLLKTSGDIVEETLYSHLLKSNCLVTGQPDWGSVSVSYLGPQINKESLLRYLVSFRNHNEFHEQCVERIYTDIQNQCKPQKLKVFARYTRRGGLDINPYRESQGYAEEGGLDNNTRLFRQ